MINQQFTAGPIYVPGDERHGTIEVAVSTLTGPPVGIRGFTQEWGEHSFLQTTG